MNGIEQFRDPSRRPDTVPVTVGISNMATGYAIGSFTLEIDPQVALSPNDAEGMVREDASRRLGETKLYVDPALSKLIAGLGNKAAEMAISEEESQDDIYQLAEYPAASFSDDLAESDYFPEEEASETTEPAGDGQDELLAEASLVEEEGTTLEAPDSEFKLPLPSPLDGFVELLFVPEDEEKISEETLRTESLSQAQDAGYSPEEVGATLYSVENIAKEDRGPEPEITPNYTEPTIIPEIINNNSTPEGNVDMLHGGTVVYLRAEETFAEYANTAKPYEIDTDQQFLAA